MKKFRKAMILLLVISMVFSLAACSDEAGEAQSDENESGITPMEAGEYVMDVDGYKSMTVQVTLSEGAVEDIEVLEHEETPGVSDAALEEIPEEILNKQSLNVDTISGATMTSDGILKAVSKAIEEAGGVVEEFKAGSEEKGEEVADENRPSPGSAEIPEEWDYTHDVVVVGGGFAGLSAAYQSSTAGADTLLIDKMPALGGNSQINGGVYASYTSSIADDLYDKLSLEPDSAEQHIEDTMEGGDQFSDRKLVENFVHGAPVFLDMMLENGLEVRESITRPGGHYGYRTYTTINGIGSDIVSVQRKMLDETSTEVMLNTEMVEIYRESTGDHKVVGIRVETNEGMKNIKAENGVILTTGGFSGNPDMRGLHVPMISEDELTSNHVGATGEGIPLAQEVGAGTKHMSYIQLYPFSDPENGRLDAAALIPFSGPSAGVVYVDVEGDRYVNEGGRRDECAWAAQDSGGFPTFAIFGQEIVEKGGFIDESQLEDAIENGRVIKANTLEDLADKINQEEYQGERVSMSGESLKETIMDHNAFIEQGEDPEFGKRIDEGTMLPTEEAPYYAVPQWPSVHHTMGGLTISGNTEVQDIWGETIPGLYAAGEVVGGVHGTNRLGSNAIPDAAVHGYIAGKFAATGNLPEFVPER